MCFPTVGDFHTSKRKYSTVIKRTKTTFLLPLSNRFQSHRMSLVGGDLRYDWALISCRGLVANHLDHAAHNDIQPALEHLHRGVLLTQVQGCLQLPGTNNTRNPYTHIEASQTNSTSPLGCVQTLAYMSLSASVRVWDLSKNWDSLDRHLCHRNKITQIRHHMKDQFIFINA